jgi:hypothetical protein
MSGSFRRLFSAGALWLFWGLLSGSCGTSPTATAIAVCDAYEKGLLVCSSVVFDTAECKSDLPCVFELYRSEASDFFLRCADRYNRGECPSLEDYLCADDEAAYGALAANPPAPATDYMRAFQTKETACGPNVSLARDVYNARAYVRQEALSASRACLERPCPEVNDCLRATLMQLAPTCL